MPNSKIPVNILLAEEDADDRLFFTKALTEMPIATNLTVVQDGEKLMNYLHRSSKHLPDIIFLELNMRHKNGIEALSEIKEDEKLKNIAVVIFTISVSTRATDLEKDLKNMLFKIGASSFIRKSSDLAQLKEGIHTELIKAIEKRSSRTI
jgi:CheY-like chemotaxis protein